MAETKPAVDKKYFTSADLIASVAAKCKCTKKDARQIVNSVKESLYEMLNQKTEVRVDGLGTFRKVTRPAREGFNPRTREKIQLPESRTVFFRSAKLLREKI